MNSSPERLAVEGQVHVLFAFDIGFQVDLERAQSLAQESTRLHTVRSRRSAPTWFDFEPAPIRLLLKGAAETGLGFGLETDAEVILYDFGVALITFVGSLPGTLGELPELSRRLYADEKLPELARNCARAVLDQIRPAVERPRLHESFEDYWIFSIRSWDRALDTDGLEAGHWDLLARTVESETGRLSAAQVERVREGCLSYAPEDLAVIDWNAAVLLDADPEDVVAVLKHANVELLELRVLDGELDMLLDHADETMASLAKKRMWLNFQSQNLLQRYANVQIDAVVLFEGVNNSIKLIGNQYLARLHRLAGQRLDLPAWSANVERKIGVAEGLYQKMSDVVGARRLEVLEWVIIVLITISIVLPFTPWY
ncbi:MAG: hypothetical protein R3F17_06005 [Planctomycetota bacterium]